MNTPLPESWLAHDRSLRPYLWSHRIVSWGSSLIGLLLVVWLLFYQGIARVEARVNEMAHAPFARWMLFFAAVVLLSKLASFPFSIAGYVIERKFNLSRQTFGKWLLDQVKGILVAAVLGFIVLGVLYWLTTSGHPYWWVGAWAFLVFFSIVLAQLLPVVLLPIFIKMKPLEGELRTRLLELASRFKVKVAEVYQLGLGEKTEKGNAAFLGIGRTKRIVIGDTLHQKFPIDEVEAVFAHELGHQVHHDLWKGLALSAFFMLFTLFLADLAFGRFVVGSIATAPGLFVFFVFWTLVQIPFNVAQAYYSRQKEWAADDFASTTVGMAPPLASALERLTFQNKGQFKPNAIWEWLTYSHPAPWRRILKLRK